MYAIWFSADNDYEMYSSFSKIIVVIKALRFLEDMFHVGSSVRMSRLFVGLSIPLSDQVLKTNCRLA